MLFPPDTIFKIKICYNTTLHFILRITFQFSDQNSMNYTHLETFFYYFFLVNAKESPFCLFYHFQTIVCEIY